MAEHSDATVHAPDNNSLADALAGVLRLNPHLPLVDSVSIASNDLPSAGWEWETVVHPCADDEEVSIDAVRAYAAAFGPEAELHLDEARVNSAGATYRFLTARAMRGSTRLEAWRHIAHTPAPADHPASLNTAPTTTPPTGGAPCR
jgi:hypothetical protein